MKCLIDKKQRDQYHQWVPTCYSINTIHKIIGVDDAYTNHQGDQNNPPRFQVQDTKILKNQKHSNKMNH